MNWHKYALAFVITAVIFGTAFYIAYRFDRARIADIRTTQEAIAIDILSTETQFDLLGRLDCGAIRENPILSNELNSLANRLSVAEHNLGADNAEVIALKKQYSLLQIKDYLLMQEISSKCTSEKPVFVLYFYSNEGDCTQCGRAGDVLTYLRQTYPDLRIYSFDHNLDLGALETLISLRKVRGEELPAFVINNRPAVYGFKSLDEMRELIPELAKLATSSTSLLNP